MSGPLSGIQVVEIAHHLVGPLTTMYLADLGAEVVKVEPPEGDDWRRRFGPPIPGGTDSRYFVSINRNKRSLALDLGQPEGQAIVQRLAARSDVLVENFTPGVAERLGIGYETLAQINPRLIYCGLSGFGETGPSSHRRAFDIVVEGETGLLTYRPGIDELPLPARVPLNDTAGPMLLAYGIAAALFARERSGRGQKLTTSLLDIAIALQAHRFIWFATEPTPSLTAPKTIVYRVYRTADGFLTLAVLSERLWRRLCQALGLETLFDDPRYSTWEALFQNQESLRPTFEERFQAKPTAEWLEKLQTAGIPCGRVRPGEELFTDPQVEANGMVVELEYAGAGKAKVMGTPLRFRDTPGSIRRSAPAIGEHSEEILGELGYTAREIQQLRQTGVVRVA